MSPPNLPPVDRQPAGEPHFDMEGFIGYILLGGVLLSMTLVIVGLGWNWVATGNLGVAHMVKGTNLLRFLTAIAHGASLSKSQPDLLVNLGIGVLMLTPYLRVLGSTLYFAFALRSFKYTVFTCFVLCILTYVLFIR